jgi:pimeloyl-ACP methyl ester carboxylesterase
MPAKEETFKTRDVTVRLLRGGEGMPVIFFHGPTGFPGWIPIFDQLAARYQVLVPEHPGFGRSDNPAWIRNVPDVAMYYLDFLDQLGAEKAHLIGHALGGWIAAELAVRNSSKLASLTLIAPAGIRMRGVPIGDDFIWSPEEAVRNLFYDESLAEQTLAKTLTEEETELQLTNRFMAAKLGWEPRWFNPALERWLHRIDVPTMIVWGAEDKFLPSRYAELWRERVADARVELIAQCGHLAHIEKPDAVARKILAFLDRK